MMRPPPRYRPNDVVITPYSDSTSAFQLGLQSNPTSAVGVANLARFWPVRLEEPFTVLKAFLCHGATVGTNSWDIGAYEMTDLATGRLDLIRSTGAVLSAGSANVVAESGTWKIAAANITTGVDSTDATAYTTASVTLKTGRLYLMSFVNTAADAAVISGIAGGPTWTSRSTTQYNTTAHRVSIWSGVPTSDYTGTIVVSFGGTQTGGRWSLNEFSNVDTASTDGIVQQATGTGSSTTPLATLAAFGSTSNATFGALANAADSTTTPGTGFRELSDLTTSTTPASFLQTEWREDNDTTVDGTITSGVWGACAVEIKASTAAFVLPATVYGGTRLYLAYAFSGTTMTVFQASPWLPMQRARGSFELTAAFPLPSTCTPVAVSAARIEPILGLSSRSLIA